MMINKVGILTIVLALSKCHSILATVNYTKVETAALEKFRKLVEPSLYRDFMRRDEYLIRWIHDQDFNLEKAQTKLLATIKWRKENGVDSAIDEDFADIERLCPYSIDGRDKTGRPILTAALGSCPVKRIVLGGNIQRLHRMVYFFFEQATNYVQDLQLKGSPVSDGMVIADVYNFNLREHMCYQCIPMAFDVLTLYESHYPQYFHEVYVINVPRAAESLLPLVWPFLSDEIKKRVHLFGFNKDEWKAAILKNVSPDQLDPRFGGTKKRTPFVPLSKPRGGSAESKLKRVTSR